MNNAELKAHLSSLPQPALYVLCPPLSSKFRATDTVVTYWQWGADNCARHTKLFFHMRTENIQSVREEFRQHSYVSKVAVGVIAGLGVRGYALALQAMAELLQDDREGAAA